MPAQRGICILCAGWFSTLPRFGAVLYSAHQPKRGMTGNEKLSKMPDELPFGI